jgi:hypothetical protein
LYQKTYLKTKKQKTLSGSTPRTAAMLFTARVAMPTCCQGDEASPAFIARGVCSCCCYGGHRQVSLFFVFFIEF